VQAKAETLIRVLVVDDRPEEAEALITSLRNDGLLVRATRPTTEEELTQQLGQNPFDLVLASMDAKALPFATVERLVSQTGKDLPVILIIDSTDEASLYAAIEQGAENLALRGKAGHVREMVNREFRDLSGRRDLRRLEAQVRETERRCDALIDSSRDPIAYVHEGMHIRANAAYLEMFGYEGFDEIEGMSILDMVSPADADAFKSLLKRLSKGEAPPARHELQARDAEGNDFPAVMEFASASYEGEPCLQIIFRRQAADPALAEELEDLRRRDAATGLLNRPTFLHALETAVASAATAGATHGLLLVQLDHHAQLLQQIGLDAADKLVAALGARIRPLLGEGAELARYGENVVGVLLPNGNHTATQTLGDAIIAAVASDILSADDKSINATASVGSVQINERNAQVARVLAKATELLESAAAIGGNRHDLFDPSAVDRAEQDRIDAWLQRIRDAITNDELVLHYQPIANLQGLPEPLYETYVRIDNGGGDLVMPGVFMPLAEEHGLMRDIDRAVIHKAIIQLKSGQPGVRLITHVGRASVEDPAFVAEIQAAIRESGLEANRFYLLTHEANASSQLSQTAALQQALAAVGSGLIIGRFGAGLNSVQLMNHVKPAFVKLDGSFMTDFSKSQEQQTRVKDLAGEAKKLGIPTIASEVADPQAMTLLFMNGVDFVQGEFLAAAGPEMNFDF